jgi:uncharacterized membrane protein YqhA
MENKNFEGLFARFRKISIIAVVASGFGAVLMFIIGAVKVFKAYKSYFFTEALTGTGPLSGANVSIAYLVQAIDAFLIALVMMIFGAGIFSLFVQDEAVSPKMPSKLFQIRDMAELKQILAELIVVILMVKFLEGALLGSTGTGWGALVLPAAVLMFALAVWILRFEHK